MWSTEAVVVKPRHAEEGEEEEEDCEEWLPSPTF